MCSNPARSGRGQPIPAAPALDVQRLPLGVCLQHSRKPPRASALGEVCSNGVLWCTRRSPWMIDGDPPHEFAFKRYWSEEAREGRDYVHKNFNCEDLLMNFMYANASSGMGRRTVEYVHPVWAIDTSKLSSVTISRDTQKHYDVRTKCLAKFSSIYGPLPQKWEFGRRQDGWDK
ncbi:hypothetical protein ZWY2020_025168 [Hordeum vulgare]|nr:hypothetical protein ZWY2020_025168 [Hordeum vulgare]